MTPIVRLKRFTAQLRNFALKVFPNSSAAAARSRGEPLAFAALRVFF
jgi:hypothetical protein